MKCDGCTLCCKLFDLPELNKKAGENCKYCIEKKGCAIYNNRPDICRCFNCAYLQQEDAPIELRPDKCGMIFERISDKTFYGTQDNSGEMTDVAKGQVNAFLKQGYSVIIKKEFHLAKGHKMEDIKQDLINKYNNRYGSA